jgi:hypothetical protein
MISGTYIYYLSSVDKNGFKKQEGAIAINLNPTKMRYICLSPNPAEKMTYLNLIGYDNGLEGKLEIYSSTGLSIKQIEFTGNIIPINTEGLISGIYTIKILVDGEIKIILLGINQ